MRVQRWVRWLLGLAAIVLGLMPALPAAAGGNAPGTVLVLHIDNLSEIDNGTARHVQQVLSDAADDSNVKAIVLHIDTPGGYVASALKIKDALMQSKVPTIAYVETHAYSAGALIALACQKVYLFPTAVMGAAEPIPATDKTVSAIKAEFKAIATERGRDPLLAQAMVDKDLHAPGQQAGQVMTFTAAEAVEKHLADGQANGIDDALRQAGIADFHLQDVRPSLAERTIRVLTTPLVAVLLLILGIGGLAIEFLKPGVTLPGLIGVVSIGLFFMGNFMSGSASLLELGLLLLGIVLFLIEAFIPGFGVFGVGGAISVLASIFFSVDDPTLAIWYLAITGVGFGILIFLLFRQISRRGLGRLLTLERSNTTADGYVPGRKQLEILVGQEGVALSALRPSGSAEISGRRLDVVTQGEFLPAGTSVEVIAVDGARVTVRSLERA